MIVKKNDNLSAILEYPYDFERLIEEQLREIEDIEERKFAKTMLAEGLCHVIQQTEQKYQNLENHVYESLKIPGDQYETMMTVIRWDQYDPGHDTLYLVLLEDLKVEMLTDLLSTEAEV